jgi:hypothetical protein
MRTLVLLLVGVLATSAAADVVCQKKKGAIVLRASCKKRETTVTLPIDAPKGPPGDAGSAAPAPVRVVEANGTPVGVYADPGTEDNATFVVFEFADGFAYLIAHAGGVAGGDALFYESTDCSGPPLFFADPTDFVRRAVVMGTTAYAPGDPITTHAIASYEYDPNGGSCNADVPLASGRCCSVSASELEAGPAVVLFDTSTLAPPLRIEP